MCWQGMVDSHAIAATAVAATTFATSALSTALAGLRHEPRRDHTVLRPCCVLSPRRPGTAHLPSCPAHVRWLHPQCRMGHVQARLCHPLRQDHCVLWLLIRDISLGCRRKRRSVYLPSLCSHVFWLCDGHLVGHLLRGCIRRVHVRKRDGHTVASWLHRVSHFVSAQQLFVHRERHDAINWRWRRQSRDRCCEHTVFWAANNRMDQRLYLHSRAVAVAATFTTTAVAATPLAAALAPLLVPCVLLFHGK